MFDAGGSEAVWVRGDGMCRGGLVVVGYAFPLSVEMKEVGGVWYAERGVVGVVPPNGEVERCGSCRDPGVAGVAGMNVGGAGKDSRRWGTPCRRLGDVMAAGGELIAVVGLVVGAPGCRWAV